MSIGSLSLQQTQLFESIASGVDIALVDDAAGECLWNPVSTLEQAVEVFDSGKQKKRLEAVASFLLDALRSTPKIDPHTSLESLEIKATRKFCKQSSVKAISPQLMNDLQSQLLASKLGVTVSNLQASADFATFAQSSHLERYLARHSHTLQVDSPEGEISILCGGEYKPWHEAREYLEGLKQANTIDTDYPSLPWHYGQDGIQVKDMYQWDKVEPFMFDDPKKWGDQFVFELCTTCSSDPRLALDHTFIRLKTPSQPSDEEIPCGAVYSVGLYRPNKRNLSELLAGPLRTKQGFLMMPDVSEYWDCEIQSISIAIDESTFKSMIATIEQCKENAPTLTFQILSANCTMWALMIAAVGNINIPSGENAIKALLPSDIAVVLQKICEKTPRRLIKFIEFLTSITINILISMLGGTIIDKDIRDNSLQEMKPHIEGINDLLKPSKATIHHPFTLGMRRRKEIEQWRESKKEKLLKQIEELEAIVNKASAEEIDEQMELSRLIQELRDKCEKLSWSIPKRYMTAPAA